MRLRDRAVGSEVEVLERWTQCELRRVNTVFGFVLAAVVTFSPQHGVEEVGAAPLNAGGLGHEAIERVRHAEKLHFGHQVSGNGVLIPSDSPEWQIFLSGWNGIGGTDVTKHRIARLTHDVAAEWIEIGLLIARPREPQVWHAHLVEVAQVSDGVPRCARLLSRGRSAAALSLPSGFVPARDECSRRYRH